MKKITFAKPARKSLSRIPANIRDLILSKIEAYATNPMSQANNVKKLKGSNQIRLRVGDWRVIMTETGEVLEIHEVLPRGSAYKH